MMTSFRESSISYRGIRVAVVGAAGFIGRWLTRALSLQGAKVFLIVRNKSKAESVFSNYAISGEVVELDATNYKAVLDLFQKIRPAITFNLAGYGVYRSECEEKVAYSINGHLVEVVARSADIVRDPAWFGQDMVHVGSAMEYGAINGNLSEDSIPKPTTLYAKSKLAGTTALEQFCKSSGLKALTARFFTIYGPGDHEDKLLSLLLKIAKNGESIQLTSGLPERDFTYIDDAVEGLLRLGLCTASPGEIVNLATGKLNSVRCFIETAAEILNIEPSKLEFGAIPTRPEEMKHSEVALDRAHKLIGWIPATSIREGIIKTKLFVESHSFL